MDLINPLVHLIYGSIIALISIWTNSACSVGIGVNLPPRNRVPHCALGVHSTQQILESLRSKVWCLPSQAVVETGALPLSLKLAWVCIVSGWTSLQAGLSHSPNVFFHYKT